METFAAIAAVLACALFAGASMYINLVDHPARLSVGTEIAATQWAPSYKRATVMQVTLAVTATLAGIIRGASGEGTLWFVGAALIFAVNQGAIVAPRKRGNYWKNGGARMRFAVRSAYSRRWCSSGQPQGCEAVRASAVRRRAAVGIRQGTPGYGHQRARHSG
jgi:hypothetical protein